MIKKVKTFYENSTKIHILINCSLFLFLIVSMGISVANGQANISLSEVIEIFMFKVFGKPLNTEGIDAAINIIWFVRMPRVLMAALIGMGLALCGLIMQAIVQNPLADPYILGVSSGATLGATFAIMIGFGSSTFLSQFGVAFGAFTGSLLATIFVFILSSIGGRITSVKLILSGTIIGSLCSSFSSLIVYLANNTEGIRSVTFWSMGSLASANWLKLPIVGVITVIVILFFFTQARILNVMLLGDETAITLGIPLVYYRRIYMLLTSLLTGVLVASVGMIGFVGLIIPHIVRGFFGTDHKKTILITVLSGAVFLVWADLVSRILIANVELPIGIVTSVVGAPLFIYIIIKKGYSFGG